MYRNRVLPFDFHAVRCYRMAPRQAHLHSFPAQRQLQHKAGAGAAIGAVLAVDAPAVAGGDGPHQRQPQADAAGAFAGARQAVERLKDALAQRLGHAGAVVADAQQRSMSRTVRVIKPGMAVTMDYRTDRLNIDVTDRNVVTATRCG